MRNTSSCNPFCAGLPPALRESLCRHSIKVDQKHKQITNEDSANHYLEIISEGLLCIFEIFEDGSQKSVEIIQPGDVMGTHLLFEGDLQNDRMLNDNFIKALTDIKKCIIPISFAQDLFHQDSTFAQALMQNLSNRFTRNNKYWVKMHCKSGEERVAYICNYLQGIGIESAELTHEEIALIAGLSRVSVTRAIQALNKIK